MFVYSNAGNNPEPRRRVTLTPVPYIAIIFSMKFSKTIRIALISELLAFAVISAGLYFWRESIDVRVSSDLKEIANLSKAFPVLPPPPTAKPQPPAPALNMPSLNGPIIVTTAISKESADKAKEKIAGLRDELKKQSDLFLNWLELALYEKLIGDYKGAEQVWTYVTKQWPQSSTAYSNLANLYVYELPDLGLAEKYYLKAIQVTPKLVSNYYSAYEFYRFVKKDIAKAKEILNQGIAEIPDNAEDFGKLIASLSTP